MDSLFVSIALNYASAVQKTKAPFDKGGSFHGIRKEVGLVMRWDWDWNWDWVS